MKSAHRYRQGVGIVEFDEVIDKWQSAGREPFVNFQSRRIAERVSLVGGAKTRLAEKPVAVIETSDGLVRNLKAEHHRIEPRAAIGDGVVEVNRVPIVVERE